MASTSKKGYDSQKEKKYQNGLFRIILNNHDLRQVGVYLLPDF